VSRTVTSRAGTNGRPGTYEARAGREGTVTKKKDSKKNDKKGKKKGKK
jgi:hypothetical protein